MDRACDRTVWHGSQLPRGHTNGKVMSDLESRRLLLISSSRVHGSGFLEFCQEAIREHLDGRDLLFVPYALADHDGYEALVAKSLAPIGVEVVSLHQFSKPREAVQQAKAIFVGGGNSFRLLKSLYEFDLVQLIHRRVMSGDLFYMGSSAGTNMACPTMRTTNDMPIVEPPMLTALGLIPFQINPHYLDPDPSSTHKGETREQRIAEFHEENSTPVLGIREGSWLEIRGMGGYVRGVKPARLFEQGQAPRELEVGADLSGMLSDG